MAHYLCTKHLCYISIWFYIPLNTGSQTGSNYPNEDNDAISVGIEAISKSYSFLE